MSSYSKIKRTTLTNIAARKKSGEPIVCLTAYSAPMAQLLDAHTDLLLVGDSVGTVHHGHENTVQVTVEEMILHGRSVMRVRPKSLVVVDMPFGSYEASPEQAFDTASYILKETGADAVKLEGGVTQAPTIEFLTQRGIAVMAHIGLLPQSVLAAGGYKIVGKNNDERERLLKDAAAVEAAGAFAVVLEGVVEGVAKEITATLSIPTIGIGASPDCDGQILVTEDMLGLLDRVPKFVRKYAELNKIISGAAEAYARDVRTRKFPAMEETYSGGKNKS